MHRPSLDGEGGGRQQDLSKPVFFDPSPVLPLARKERPVWSGDIEFPIPQGLDQSSNEVGYHLIVEGVVEKGKAKNIRATIPLTVRSGPIVESITTASSCD